MAHLSSDNAAPDPGSLAGSEETALEFQQKLRQFTKLP
jgi:hypothetical protein